MPFTDRASVPGARKTRYAHAQCNRNSSRDRVACQWPLLGKRKIKTKQDMTRAKPFSPKRK